MRNRLIIVQVVTLAALCGVGIHALFAAENRKDTKRYVRSLEAVLSAKLAQDNESLLMGKSAARGDQKEVGDAIIKDIKAMLKNAYLDLLASSELATWADIKSRFEAVKRANELFEVKYTVELKGTTAAAPVAPGLAPTPPAAPASMGMGVPSTPPPSPAPVGMSGPDMGMGMAASTPPPAPIPAPASMVMGMPSTPPPSPTPSPAPMGMGMPATPPPPPVPAPAPMGMPSTPPLVPASTGMPEPGMGMGMPATPPPSPAPAPMGMGMPATPPPPPAPAPAPMGGMPTMGMGGMPMA